MVLVSVRRDTLYLCRKAWVEIIYFMNSNLPNCFFSTKRAVCFVVT